MRGVGTYLNGTRLRRIAKLIGEQQSLVSAVRQVLPASVAAHCVSAVIEGSRLTLFADSVVWATQLRFLGPEVARMLGSRIQTPYEVRVRVAPPKAYAQSPAISVIKPLSRATGRLLSETAASVSDQRLQEALRRLASHTSPPQNRSEP